MKKTTFKTTSPLEDIVEEGFEERADQLTVDELRSETITNYIFDHITRELTTRGLVVLEGPRGCGKTHMMRFVDLVCTEDRTKPLSIYVSFNRYLRLEPLLNMRSDALDLFHTWALALLVRAITLKADDLGLGAQFNSENMIGVSSDEINNLIAELERSRPPKAEHEDIISYLTIEKVLNYVRAVYTKAGRRRAVLLFDDAALTLSKDLLVEFFDLIRVLKSQDISPKISVYPGTTEYGPRFHVDHEGKRVEAWLSVEEPDYLTAMRQIADLRYQSAGSIPDEVDKVLMYASFGIPRAYLKLLREWVQKKSSHATSALNKIIREHHNSRLEEFRSLATKLPTLATLVRTGEYLFETILDTLVKENHVLIKKEEKQLLLGISRDDLSPIVQRMVSLLIEVGLIRQESEVSHGENRRYTRYMVHLGSLLADRAFAVGRGSAPKTVITSLSYPNTKHPVRRSLVKLLGEGNISGLHLDEPPCTKCGTHRLSPGQKFCHSCGSKLLNDSTYERCMQLSLSEVPGLSKFKQDSLNQQNLNTIQDIVALSDPGTTIRRSRGMGKVRAEQTISTIQTYVDEFLS